MSDANKNAEDSKKAVTIKVPSADAPNNKENKKKADELNEDDLQLKADIELLVTRLADSAAPIVNNAIETLTTMLRTHSGSVASIPKPLKFVRALFPQLETALASVKTAAAQPSDEQTSTSWRTNLRRLYDLMSFIGMTMDVKNMSQTSLSFKLQGTLDDLADWGHEYMRFLAGEIASEWERRVDAAAEKLGEDGTAAKPDASDLRGFQSQIVKFMLHHQDESTAIDLLIENEDLEFLIQFVDEHNFHRIAAYIVGVSRYLQAAQRETCLHIACTIYEKEKALCQALRVALTLHDDARVQKLFDQCDNDAVKLQMALICGRSRIFIESLEENDLLADANCNRKLPELFRHAAKELDALAPKAPKDIYKTAADGKAAVAPSSYMQNLANLMVNGLVNAGYGTDSIFGGEQGNTAVYLTKDHRQMSATAALGLVHLWDESQGLSEVDKYNYADSPAIKGGAHLATGIVLCGVKSQFDAAIGLLTEHVQSPHKEQQVGAILGLGLAYAGMRKEEVKELLVPLLVDSERPLEVQCMAAYACALVFPGTCNEDLVEACMASLMDKDEKVLLDPAIRYLILALGCFFLGQQARADTLLDAVALLPDAIRRYTEVVVRSCAYAGTGNVLEVQRLFNIVAEADEGEEDEKKPEEGAAAAAAAGGAAAGGAGATAAAEDAEAPAAAAAKAEEKKPTTLSHKAAAVLGIGLVAMGEELGEDMARRSLIHVLLADTVSRSGSQASGRRSVPLAYALLALSTANPSVVEMLNRLSHDSDVPTAQNAILSMGLVAAGTNNARVATMLRALAQYYHKDKDSNVLMMVRLAQGLTTLGKGHLTLSPFQQDRSVLCQPSLVGLLGLLHSSLDLKATILDRYHYMFYTITPAINPRMILAVNEQLAPVDKGALVRVGVPVDTVTVAGRPKTITGFQTHSTPVLLSDTERAELAAGKHKTVATTVIEGVVVVEEKQLTE